MLHAADGDGNWFDRALVWQPDLNETSNVIVRGPLEEMPSLGVNAQLDLLVTGDEPASSGYTPLAVAGSTGAVQAQGVQQLAAVSGLNEVGGLDARGLRMSLLPKNGRMPYLNGYNHLVWRDGEPIDPFVLALLASDDSVIWQREIFNDGKRLMEMSPLQRLYTARGPCGLIFAPPYPRTYIPAWALTPEEQAQLDNQAFPQSYLDARAAVLLDALRSSLAETSWTRDSVDEAISFAERLRLVASPQDTTFAWLFALCYYGHTLSGDLATPAGWSIPGHTPTGLQLDLAPVGDRKKPNGRWYVNYVQGVMDTDALSAKVYGELYIPVDVTAAGKPVTFTRTWQFPADLQTPVNDFAVQFDGPFWTSKFTVDGKSRTLTLADKTTITDRLTGSTPDSYSYSASGSGISAKDWVGSFATGTGSDGITLTWQTTFTPADAESTVRLFSIAAAAAAAMTESLDDHFSPH
jgi:hypothetical protein